jgi:hypothetical protein
MPLLHAPAHGSCCSTALLAAEGSLLHHRHESRGAPAGVVRTVHNLQFFRWFKTIFCLAASFADALWAHSLLAVQGGWLLLSLDEQSAVDFSVCRRLVMFMFHARCLPSVCSSLRLLPHAISSPRSARSHDKDRDSIRNMLSAFNR